MSNDVPGATAPSPPDPALRAAKLAVIILSTLIILALIALVVGGVRQFTRPRPAQTPQPAAAAQSVFMLPMGARVLEMQTQAGRLVLHLRTLDGEEIDILDTADGHLVSRIKAAQ